MACGKKSLVLEGFGRVETGFKRLPLIIVSAFVLLFFQFSTEAQCRETQNVLVLHSYHKGLTWTDSEDSGIRSVFQSRTADIELHTEYLDSKVSADQEHFQKIFELLKHRYSNVRFKAIIATDDDAYNFYLQYHEKLFPEVPVIFCGVNYFQELQRKGQENFITGVIESFDISKTIKTVLRLHPDTLRIVIINDKSTTGLANKKILSHVLQEFESKIKFDLFEDLSMAELKENVALLDRGDIILLMTFNKDRLGRIYSYDQSIAQIAASAKVPIYGVWDFYLGKGIVGGMLTSGFDQGKTAAEMTIRYLDGSRISNLPVVRVSPNKYKFDHKELQWFGIDESSLPEWSVVINRPFSFYEKNKGLVWSIVSGFTALSIIIILLLAIIRQRLRTEEVLRDSEARFRSLVEQSPIGIVIVRDMRIIYANTKYALMYGYGNADEVISHNLQEMMAQGSWDSFFEVTAGHIMGQSAEVVFEGQCFRKDGTDFIAMVTASRIILTDGPASIGFVQDITNRKKDELEISRLNEELVRKEKLAMLGQLSGSVSHELRNPLGVINNAIYLLRVTLKDADETTREYLDIIKQEIDNSLKIVTDLLDFARKKPAQPQSIRISELIASCLKKCAVPQNVDVETDISANLPMLRIDPQQIEQVFQNLFTNGIQAMPEGGVLCVTVRKALGPGTDFVEINVMDSGEGIAAEHLHKIFQPLFTTKSRGIGLGLVVCKNLVEANKGSIKVESEPGQGTIFTVLLPVEPEPHDIEENF